MPPLQINFDKNFGTVEPWTMFSKHKRVSNSQVEFPSPDRFIIYLENRRDQERMAWSNSSRLQIKKTNQMLSLSGFIISTYAQIRQTPTLRRSGDSVAWYIWRTIVKNRFTAPIRHAPAPEFFRLLLIRFCGFAQRREARAFSDLQPC